MEREGEGGIATGRGAGSDFHRSRSVSFGEHHSAPHDIERFFWSIPTNKNFISLSPAAARMHKLLGEGAVVGQNEESFRKIVQAADRGAVRETSSGQNQGRFRVPGDRRQWRPPARACSA